MLDILELHDEVFQILLDHNRDLDENLFFSLRKSNRYNKLDDGYWFHGNDDYLAVSFWSGGDWKNKTPNIFFVISKTGRTLLEISVQDSSEKKEFVNKYLVKPLGLEGNGPKYYKEYNPASEFNYLDSLRDFINPDGDKKIIDDIIIKQGDGFFKSSTDKIGFINQREFDENLELILKLKNIQKISKIEKPIKLKSFTIKGYGPIKELNSKEIPFTNQFIFLTGINGTGKSSVLKALGIALSQKEIEKDEKHKKDKFDVTLELYDKFGQTHTKVRLDNDNVSPRLKPVVLAMAAYGPVRLQTANSDLTLTDLRKAFNKSNIIDSLREEDSFLLDIHTHFKHWKQQPKHKKYIKKRKEKIEGILQDLFDLKFKVKINDNGVVYEEVDNNGVLIGSVSYKKLSTGLRSTLSLMGDLLIRMYEQQPDIIDPSFFEGIVIIDEIDIHLHPILQKRIVKELAETFPKLQFVITTHSPIPLLGAPKNSVILKVNRNNESGVYVDRLENKIYLTDLLPNTILTSPIFGLDEIINENHEPNRILRTEKTFTELEFNDKVKSKIDSFITDEIESKLITLFENRRK